MGLRKTLKVGDDFVHYCSRCKLELGHRILAMRGSEPARVRCNTCYSERNFKKQAKSHAAVKQVRERQPKKTSSHSEFYQQKLTEAGGRPSVKYRIDQSFKEGDLVEHKLFGLGVVLKVIPPDRVEIVFSEEIKMLAAKI